MRALLATDLDGTLTGDPAALARLLRGLASLRGELGLAYATGRGRASTRELMREAGLPEPDVLIAEVGSAVYLDGARDLTWTRRLQAGWDAARVRHVLGGRAGLVPQPRACQSRFKCSYELRDAALLPGLELALAEAGLGCRLVYSSGLHLDVLPVAGGKGQALRYVAERLGLPHGRILACGDSGNDLDLLAHGGPAAAVGNGLPELLAGLAPAVYRARGRHAAGVAEALVHFGFAPRHVMT